MGSRFERAFQGTHIVLGREPGVWKVVPLLSGSYETSDYITYEMWKKNDSETFRGWTSLT